MATRHRYILKELFLFRQLVFLANDEKTILGSLLDSKIAGEISAELTATA
nr:hypothetical protein [Evansella caseinilytica]